MIQFLSLFSGIGAFEKALDRLGVEYNLVNYCEIDKYASKSYSTIHNVPESLNLGDITKVDTSKLPHIDMITYGFPCQDISINGKMKGFENEDGTKTRSGLFFEALRIIEDTKPKVAIAENVKNLTSNKFSKEFNIVLQSLEAAGYNNYWKVLNTCIYGGLPQNRERVFIVSIRKDLDTGLFKFPDKVPLTFSIEDLLEIQVSDKYYLTDRELEVIKNTDYNYSKHKHNTEKIINGNYSEFAIMDYRYDEGLRVRENKICPTLTTRLCMRSISGKPIVLINNRLRFITALEGFRLQGFTDNDYFNALKVNDEIQIGKQAGNSITVDVLVYLFKEILEVIDMKKVDDKVTVFEGNDLIDLVALKEKEPELYEELLADYPCESGTYIFKNKVG